MFQLSIDNNKEVKTPMTDEKNHGFSEQDFKGEGEESDENVSGELFRRFFYENGGHLVATRRQAQVKTGYSVESRR